MNPAQRGICRRGRVGPAAWNQRTEKRFSGRIDRSEFGRRKSPAGDAADVHELKRGKRSGGARFLQSWRIRICWSFATISTSRSARCGFVAKARRAGKRDWPTSSAGSEPTRCRDCGSASGRCRQVGTRSILCLSRFTKNEQPEIELSLVRAADAVEVWATKGMAEAMNRFN